MKTVSFCYSEIFCIINGTASVGAHFDNARVDDKLDKIKIPTFFLHADDDQFFGGDVFPKTQHEHTLFGKTSVGGHGIWLTGAILPSDMWYTKPMFEFFNYFV
jgi:predicted alpha/beta-fold hydrolase